MITKDLITTGSKIKPITLLLHGVHGIGKTTLGTKSNNPIFVTGEEIEEIESAKFPKCKTYDDFLKYVKFLRDEDHNYKTLVIDTLDSIESLLWKQILKEDGSQEMATACGGYGKAFGLATQMFTNLRDDILVPIREKRGMNVILLCHSTKNKVENPMTQSSYDVYEMKLHKNSKGFGAYTVFAEWVQIIAFANFEVYTVKDKKSGKEYAAGEGERVMHCTPKPAYDAKNRFNLADDLPLEWDEIASGVKAFYANQKKEDKNPEVESLKIEIFEMIKKIQDEKLREATLGNVKSVGDDFDRLTKAKQYIQGVI